MKRGTLCYLFLLNCSWMFSKIQRERERWFSGRGSDTGARGQDNGVCGHPRCRGAITFNITQPTIIPFITQPTIYRVIVYALPCHGFASSTHFTELLTNQQFRLCHACDATHVNVNLRKQGGMVLTIYHTMADVVKRQENDVISWLFGR